MNREQILDLLTVAAAYDRRTVGDADVHAWGDAATREGWTYPEAAEAIKSHYARSTDYLQPGHITAALAAHRELGPPPFDPFEDDDRPPPATAEQRRRAVLEFQRLMSTKTRIPGVTR